MTPTRTNKATRRRRAKSRAEQANERANREQNRAWRKLWLADHPGRTSVEYTKLQHSEEVWEWRRAKGRAEIEAENQAWLRDHPGKPLPEHICSLTDAEYAEYSRWLEQYRLQTLQ